MNRNVQTAIFYILIIGKVPEHHVRLREIINRSIPQSYIESIYSEAETAAYFRSLRIAPGFIILDTQIQHAVLRLTIYMIRQNSTLKQVPLALVNCDLSLNEKRELKYLGVNDFYAELSNPIEMRILANDIKNKCVLT